jgi:TRAP-type mannitol/chloroaromatic compound transport system substrate-binding protein
MEASFKAAGEMYDDIASKNAEFKRLYDNQRAFRNDEYAWFRSAEYYFDNFMIRAGTRN